MARTFSNGKLSIKATGTLQNVLSNSGGSTTITHPNLSYELTLVNGIGANQANRAWQILSQSLSSGQAITLDLFDLANIDIGAGVGRDGVGQLITPLEEIVMIVVVNNNVVSAAGQLEITPDTEDGWAPIGSHTVSNGGALWGQGILVKAQPAASGFDVSDGSSHRVRFTASGGAVTFSVYLMARTDDEESSSSESSLSISSNSSSVSSSGKSSSSQSMSTSSSSQSSASTSSQSSSSQSSRSVSSSSFSSSSS